MNKLLPLIFFLSFTFSYSQNTDEDIYTDFENNGVNKQEASKILHAVANSFLIVQGTISDIASKSVPYDERIRLKKEVLKYFKSSYSIIEVTTLTTGNTTRYHISSYLDNLMKLSYYKVSLYWDHNYSVSKLFNNGNNQYEIGVGAWQYFVARNADGIIVYIDKTYKRAFFTIVKSNYGEWTIKINEIKAEDTQEYSLNKDY